MDGAALATVLGVAVAAASRLAGRVPAGPPAALATGAFFTEAALLAAACEGRPVGREGDGPDAVGVSAKRADLTTVAAPMIQEIDWRGWSRTGRRSARTREEHLVADERQRRVA